MPLCKFPGGRAAEVTKRILTCTMSEERGRRPRYYLCIPGYTRVYPKATYTYHICINLIRARERAFDESRFRGLAWITVDYREDEVLAETFGSNQDNTHFEPDRGP